MTTTTCRHRKAEYSPTLQCRVCPCGAVLPSKGNKFNAQRTEVDGIMFDSAAESRRWQQLRAMEQSGEISKLTRQVSYPLAVNGVHICTYRSDFEYHDHRTGEWVVEDVKGFRTDSYRQKRHLMLACHGIEIREVSA